MRDGVDFLQPSDRNVWVNLGRLQTGEDTGDGFLSARKRKACPSAVRWGRLGFAIWSKKPSLLFFSAALRLCEKTGLEMEGVSRRRGGAERREPINRWGDF